MKKHTIVALMAFAVLALVACKDDNSKAFIVPNNLPSLSREEAEASWELFSAHEGITFRQDGIIDIADEIGVSYPSQGRANGCYNATGYSYVLVDGEKTELEEETGTSTSASYYSLNPFLYSSIYEGKHKSVSEEGTFENTVLYEDWNVTDGDDEDDGYNAYSHIIENGEEFFEYRGISSDVDFENNPSHIKVSSTMQGYKDVLSDYKKGYILTPNPKYGYVPVDGGSISYDVVAYGDGVSSLYFSITATHEGSVLRKTHSQLVPGEFDYSDITRDGTVNLTIRIDGYVVTGYKTQTDMVYTYSNHRSADGVTLYDHTEEEHSYSEMVHYANIKGAKFLDLNLDWSESQD